jgi:transposase
VLNEAGTKLAVTQAPPDLDGLRHLAKEVAALGGPVNAAIESMNGARFVHDSLELMGWDVEIADAQKVKGLAPLALKTDKIDAWVLAELSRCDLVPAIWLLDPEIRAERERARFRLHLVRHRVMLKNRIHSSLLAFGKPCPVSDLFGKSGRELLGRLELPDPWTKNFATALLTSVHVRPAARPILAGVHRPTQGLKPAAWTSLDRDYESLRANMRVLFGDLGIVTSATASFWPPQSGLASHLDLWIHDMSRSVSLRNINHRA